jgi:hypothetical protein
MLQHLRCCISLITIEDINSSWIAWSLKVGPIGCPKTLVVTTNLHCVTSQNSDDLRDKRLFSSVSRPNLGSSQLPTYWAVGVVSSAIMCQGHEVDQLPLFCYHVNKDEWRHGSCSWWVFMASKVTILPLCLSWYVK